MRVAITGGFGFLGWHLACRLRATRGIEAIRLGRLEMANPGRLRDEVAAADVVFHLAGVNRAATDHDVVAGNVTLAGGLQAAITSVGRPVRVVYANSIQALLDNPYGQGKAEASRILRKATASVGGSMADVLLPNLFGEHGRPGYNSFVATFCHAVARGQQPTVSGDKEVELLHAQRACAELIAAMEGTKDDDIHPSGDAWRVSDVLSLIMEFSDLYSRGEIPALTDDFRVDLFNTYRSYTFPQFFPFFAETHSDIRGDLFETVRSHGGTGQAFVSTTRPGRTRGDHYHLTKVERFFVVRGEAEISLRRLLDDQVIRFRLGGARPGFVDMPTLWVHNISNVGEDDLVTMFWAAQLLDPEGPDQYPEHVVQEIPT